MFIHKTSVHKSWKNLIIILKGIVLIFLNLLILFPSFLQKLLDGETN